MVNDPLRMPRSGALPGERLACTCPLAGTPGQSYVEQRGIPLAVADAAGLRFDPDWGGRAAVIVGLRDADGGLASVHGRYLSTLRGQDKMLTVGPGGGLVSVEAAHIGRPVAPLILVEGLFDALSLAVCGWSSLATICRWAPWLPRVCRSRVVWLAFDGNQPGEREAQRYAQALHGAMVRRLRPPGRCKDWNTALDRCGPVELTRYLRQALAGDTTAS